MWFGIPGTDIGVNIDVPDPQQFANEMMGKVNNLLNQITSTLTGFFRDAAANIGSKFREIISAVPRTVFNGVKDAVEALWRALRGQ